MCGPVARFVCINWADRLLGHLAGSSITASAMVADPMPITLRNIRPDAAAKLRQLEVGAAALDRAARDLIPEELRHQTKPKRPASVAVKAKAYLEPASQAVGGALASLAAAAPYIAAALRTLRGLLADAVLCISLAGAMLFALALVVLLLAPPA